MLWLRSPGINIPQDWPSPGQYIDIRNENRSFEEMSISQGRSGTLLGCDQPQRVEGLRDFLQPVPSARREAAARPAAAAGRRRPGKPAVVVLSHGFWKRAFSADPGVVGTQHHAERLRHGSGDAKNQFRSPACCGPTSC